MEKQEENKRTFAAQKRVSNEWDAMAGEWDDLATAYRDSFFNLLSKEVLGGKSHQDYVVLDFGCGTGLLAESLHNIVKQLICIDAAPMMVQQLEYKIQAASWDNVEAHCVVLAELDQAPKEVQKVFEELKGKVDLIVASSVLSFIPEEDYAKTMKVLGDLLKPNGILFHSDWPKSESHPNGFDDGRVSETFALAGLKSKSDTTVVPFSMGKDFANVLVGVAVKP